MMIPFSPLSHPRSRSRPRGLLYPFLLFLTMSVALMGWIQVCSLRLELSDAQVSLAQLQAKLSVAQQSLSETQMKLNAQGQTPIPVVQPAFSGTTISANNLSNTNTSGQAQSARPDSFSTQMSRTTSRPHSSSR